MTSRERVVRALKHQEPDRVPKDLMGNATMLLDKCYFELRDFLKLPPISPIRKGSTANYYDERILEFLGVDFRRVFCKPNPKFNNITELTDDTFMDAWSVIYRKEGLFVNAINCPLSEVSSVQQVDKYPWPNGSQLFIFFGLQAQAKRLHDKGFAVVARNPLTAGFIDRASQLMGVENFLISLLNNKEIAKRVLKNIFRIYFDVYSAFLDEVGLYVDIVETADDIGTQNSLLISPDLYREFIKPLEKKLYSMIHDKAPEAFLFRHTDGAVYPLIEDFIEIGIDILNPVQTSTEGMDGYKLKEKFGDRITFHGAIEQSMHTYKTIVNEVQEKLHMFKPGGGYIFAPCNHIIDSTPEMIINMFKTCDNFGKY